MRGEVGQTPLDMLSRFHIPVGLFWRGLKLRDHLRDFVQI